MLLHVKGRCLYARVMNDLNHAELAPFILDKAWGRPVGLASVSGCCLQMCEQALQALASWRPHLGWIDNKMLFQGSATNATQVGGDIQYQHSLERPLKAVLQWASPFKVQAKAALAQAAWR